MTRQIFLLSLFLVASFGAFPALSQEVPSPEQKAQEQKEVQELLNKVEGQPPVPSPASPDLVPVPAPDVTAAQNPSPLTPAPLVVDETLTPKPADAGLASPQPIKAAVDIPSLPAPAPPAAVDENLFYDSEALMPGEGGGNASSAIPQKVNPVESPASRMIVVTKEAEADSGKAKLVYAQRAVQLGRYDSALRLYDQLYAENNNDPNVLLGRAVVLQKLGKNDESIHAYEELLAIRPDNIEAQINMLGLVGERYPAVALQRLRELSDSNPRDVRILAQMAVMEARSGQYDDALASLGQAASIEQKNANHLYNMAVVADRSGKKEDAVRYYEKALEIDTVYGGSRSIPRDSVYERLAQIRQ